jgi:acyl-CoA reductase-like NAD-dependent aldehyde dehydrogenase
VVRQPSKTSDVFDAWGAAPVKERLKVLKGARHRIARQASAFAGAISPELARTAADTLVAEVLPLLEACRFLEREAEEILAVRRLGRRGLPFWLAGVDSEVQRVALGKVLVIGPANYPLFLPGVQTLQALVAGNAVVWKPGQGGRAVAEIFAEALYVAGLPRELLRVTDESVEAGRAELQVGADKVFFTGSAATGRAILRELAETATPCVMELSGCDAVVVLPSADLERVVAALAFGMRLNGSATCMAPRRVFLIDATEERKQRLIGQLLTALDWVEGILLPEPVQRQLSELLAAATQMSAQVHGELDEKQRPIFVTNVIPSMEIARADVFAPLLMLMEVSSEAEVLTALEECPYALTAAVFGEERAGRSLAEKIAAGTMLVNDLIVPTADPRVPFGGRRRSGFGVTRGAEGLLEMSAVKVVSVRRGQSLRHFEATTERHEGLFGGLILAAHAGTWAERWRGIKQLMAAVRELRSK